MYLTSTIKKLEQQMLDLLKLAAFIEILYKQQNAKNVKLI